MSLRLLMLTAVPLLPVTLHAGELPKEGSGNFTNTWSMTSSTPIKVGDRTLGSYEISGVRRNDDGDAMTDIGVALPRDLLCRRHCPWGGTRRLHLHRQGRRSDHGNV